MSSIDKHVSKSFREISRLLTIVENELDGSDEVLRSLSFCPTQVIGLTGAPGVGKSTLVSALVDAFLNQNKRLAILAVDPTSPYSFGSLLGDRIRMQQYSTNPDVYIRSIATRGALGGLSSKIIEMTDVLKSGGFDYILIETVGVGQSEVEIANLADITLVVLMPESGDEIQSLKSGIMEISDAFIVNKADRNGAEEFVNKLQYVSATRQVPIIKTIATEGVGLADVVAFIKNFELKNENRAHLLTQKAWHLIREKRMGDITIAALQREIEEASVTKDFNLYRFVESKIKNS